MDPTRRATAEALKELACAASALAAALGQKDAKWSERLRQESWLRLNETIDKVQVLSGMARGDIGRADG